MEKWIKLKELGVEVSNLGNVRRFVKSRGCYVDKYMGISSKGYVRIAVKGKNYYVHRLVAKSFVYNGFNRPHVNHKNGIKTDNRSCNLEWVTPLENNEHSFDVLGFDTRVPTLLVSVDGTILKEYPSYKSALKDNGTKVGLIKKRDYSIEVAKSIFVRKKHVIVNDKRFVGQKDFSVTCDPALKKCILNDFKSSVSVKDICLKYNLSYYKVCLIRDL